MSFSEHILCLAGICLDRLLKQRSTLPNKNSPQICRRYAAV
jgi:hypothetical protein